MKNKYVKSMMGLMLSVSLIAGGTIGVYASDTTETATESTTEAGSEADSEAASEAADEEDAVYGEVKSVDGDTITFTVGTRNEVPGMEKPDGEAPQGDKPDEEAPEKPDGEVPQGDKPDGEAPDSKSFLTLTSEEREVTVSANTEIVKGMMFDGTKPDGEKPMAEESDQKDAEAMSEEETTEATPEEVTTKDAKATPEAEKLTIDDIKAGDIIKVIYDKDNNVTKIEVMNTPEEKPDEAVEKAAEQEEGTEEETTEAATEVTTEA